MAEPPMVLTAPPHGRLDPMIQGVAGVIAGAPLDASVARSLVSTYEVYPAIRDSALLIVCKIDTFKAPCFDD